MDIFAEDNPLKSYLSPDLKVSAKSEQLLDRLSRMITSSDCQKCPLHVHRGAVAPVPGAGTGRIMFVGHTIGKDEADEGIPAIGAASQYGFQLLLQAMTNEVHLQDYDARRWLLDYCYMTNAARCGHTEEASPNSGAWKKCSAAWLRQEIKLVDPAIIVFWKGNMAKTVLGAKQDTPPIGVIEERYVFGKKTPVMVMNHPVGIARNPAFEEIVKAQFATLAVWLHDQGLLLKEPKHIEPDFGVSEVDHKLVETEAQLNEMFEDLKDKHWISLDVETSYNSTGRLLSDNEEKRGAVMWYTKPFRVVSIQIAAREGDKVSTTYTLPVGFKDALTGRNQFDLEPKKYVDTIDKILAYQIPEHKHRVVAMWNAGFDATVLTRLGIDLLGWYKWNYPIQILDGQALLVRLNEHTTDTQQISLDAAARMFLLEGKGGSFTSHFDPMTFAYLDMHNPQIRKDVCEYAGGDVEKTILVTSTVLNLLKEEGNKFKSFLSKDRSSLPPMGYPPYPVAAAGQEPLRILDVAVTTDHQMIPIMTEMEMIGFRLNMEQLKKLDSYVSQQQRALHSRIKNVYSWLKPQSAPNLVHALHILFQEAADNLELLRVELNTHTKNTRISAALLNLYHIDKRFATSRISGELIRQAFTESYGEINSQQATVEDKIFVYFEVAERKTKELCASLPEETANIINRRLPLCALDKFKQLFGWVYLSNQMHKKKSTYIDRFSKLADENSIIHPSYRQHTTSGRFNGNFQNIPRGGEEDAEWTEKLLEALDYPRGEDWSETIARHNVLDVRQYIHVLGAADLNRQFEIMNLPWKVADREYVGVFADFAAQEDRMAFALTGDKTKEKLLSNPDLDTHFYNVAFCFGHLHNFDTSTEDGVMEAYEYFISNKKYKATYRTPMKTVHYASQYGAGENKLHSLLGPVFAKQGTDWSADQTKELKANYDELYRGVTDFREKVMLQLDDIPFLEYPIYGTIRHAKNSRGRIHQDEYLSAANALNQGTSAYITKTALMRMRRLIYENARRWNLVQAGGDNYVGIILQVHDEIGLICPRGLASEVAYALESAMKMIVGPGEGNAYYDDHIKDTTGATGWLYLPDEQFKGATLLDAEAEVKTFLAKNAVLPDGTINVLAETHDQESMNKLYNGPSLINNEFPLILARKGGHSYDLPI